MATDFSIPPARPPARRFRTRLQPRPRHRSAVGNSRVPHGVIAVVVVVTVALGMVVFGIGALPTRASHTAEPVGPVDLAVGSAAGGSWNHSQRTAAVAPQLPTGHASSSSPNFADLHGTPLTDAGSGATDKHALASAETENRNRRIRRWGAPGTQSAALR